MVIVTIGKDEKIKRGTIAKLRENIRLDIRKIAIRVSAKYSTGKKYNPSMPEFANKREYSKGIAGLASKKFNSR